MEHKTARKIRWLPNKRGYIKNYNYNIFIKYYAIGQQGVDGVGK